MKLISQYVFENPHIDVNDGLHRNDCVEIDVQQDRDGLSTMNHSGPLRSLCQQVVERAQSLYCVTYQ